MVKVKMGASDREEKERHESEAGRTKMKQETLWRYRNAAVSNMAPADLQPRTWGCPLSFLHHYVSIFSIFLLPFIPLVSFPLFSSAFPTQLFVSALFLFATELHSALLPSLSVLFFPSSSLLLTNGQQLPIAAAEEVQPCVLDQSSTLEPCGSLLMRHNDSRVTFSLQSNVVTVPGSGTDINYFFQHVYISNCYPVYNRAIYSTLAQTLYPQQIHLGPGSR